MIDRRKKIFLKRESWACPSVISGRAYLHSPDRANMGFTYVIRSRSTGEHQDPN